MESNIVNFKFKTCKQPLTRDAIKKHYEKIFTRYFKKLNETSDVKVEFEDLVSDETTPYNNRLKIKLYNNKSIIGSFYIYGQNNCCGAMTTSKTDIIHEYQNNKIGTIFQYLKEDIAKMNRVSQLLCTDEYYSNVSKDINLNDLKHYHRNTKVLLNTGWEISKLFVNTKSSNVVAIYTKNINCDEQVKEVILKININNNNSLLDKIEELTVGCDPELFLKSKDSGEFVPSFYVMEGTKQNPTKITKEGHSIQCDNVMVEYGIPPCKTVEEFIEHNLLVQDYIRDKVAEPNNLEVVISPAVRFNEFNLKDEKAQHMGCDPDYNAFEGGKPNPIVRATSNLRTGAGHIHLGYKDFNFCTSRELIKILDLFIGVPLVLMEPENDRKTMYGKAGAFRYQSWGVEYRGPSNYIFSSPELMKWAFEQVQNAINWYNNNSKNLYTLDNYSTMTCINNNDKTLAKSLIKQYELKTLINTKVKIN